MKDGQYYSIQGWMGKRLGLRGNDLICFAIIYGFSLDGESQFKGNLNYLTACMFATQPTALLALQHLLSCNLILKENSMMNGKKRCYYSTNIIYDDGEFIVVDKTKEPLVMTTKESLVMTTKESLPKEYNNKEYNKKREDNKLSPQKNKFIKPTIEEIEEYIKEKKFTFSAEYFYDHYESKGWMIGKNKMKDWKAACRNWARMDKNKEKENNKETDEIPDERKDGWERSKEWMHKFIPRIADRISFTDFDTMRGTVYHNREVFSEILQEINNSDYEGDIVAEFCRLAQTERYNQKIFGV